MTEKSEALRLADVLDHVELRPSDYEDVDKAAAELRRLHAENALLHERHHFDNGVLKELLEALKELDSWLVCACIATPEDMAQSFPHMQQVVSAAIAKAEGEAK
jgi:hypothetical protein